MVPRSIRSETWAVKAACTRCPTPASGTPRLVARRESQAVPAGLVLGEPYARQRRNREDDAGDSGVVDCGVRAFKNICGNNPALIACDRRQSRSTRCRAVARRVHLRIRDALQDAVHANAVTPTLHAPHIELQVVEIGDASGCVNEVVGVDVSASRTIEMNAITATDGGDGAHLSSESQVNARGPGPLDETLHEIGVELLERTFATMDDGDMCTRARCDVREFERDIPAAHEHDRRGKGTQLQNDVSRLRTGGNHDCTSGLQCRATHRKRCGSDETCDVLKRFDTGAVERIFPLLGNRVGKCALESHQIRPVDRQTVRTDAFARERVAGVERRGGGDEYLFRITTAQCARAAKRLFVDDRYSPARCAAARGNGAAGGTRADHDEVEATCHNDRSL